ncbi:MAG: transposase [Candidatus Blackburnbacteria bacterium]|nr:transposase [Candidatus Blackburnbacteria bacterium]
MIGVDVNSKCFSVSVLTPEGKVLKQLYFGKDIWGRRRKIMKRKALLQSLAAKGNHSTQRKLDKLKHSERNFVKNRIGGVVRDITNLAIKYDADIGIEKLKRFSRKSKRFNKQVFRMPFALFRKNLENRCFDKRISLKVVDAYHTSKWCSRCGAVAKKGHSVSNYALFGCECGQVVNSDRKAGLAVAVKSLLERRLHSPNSDFFQFSSRRVPVNGLFRSDEGLGSYAVHLESSPEGKLRNSIAE